MTYQITCEDCGRLIGEVPLKRDIIIKSCCRLSPKTIEEYGYQSNRGVKHANIIRHDSKKDFIKSILKRYRDYQTNNLYNEVKTKIGHKRTFYRCLLELVKEGYIEYKAYGFIRRVNSDIKKHHKTQER